MHKNNTQKLLSHLKKQYNQKFINKVRKIKKKLYTNCIYKIIFLGLNVFKAFVYFQS